MKCPNCPDYRDNICRKAQEGKLSEMEGGCLLRCAVMLLRDIWTELAVEGEDKQEGEWWKTDDP